MFVCLFSQNTKPPLLEKTSFQNQKTAVRYCTAVTLYAESSTLNEPQGSEIRQICPKMMLEYVARLLLLWLFFRRQIINHT